MDKNPALNRSSGQALILIIILLATVVTIAISAATRSVISLRETRNQQESEKAYTAAESGIEKALQQIDSGNSSNLSNITLANDETIKSVNITNQTGTPPFGYQVNNNNYIMQDQGADIWFVNHSSISNSNNEPDFSAVTSSNPGWTGDLSIYFQKSSSSNQACLSDPAIEVIVVEGTYASPTIQRYAFDPCVNLNIQRQASGAQLDGVTAAVNANGLSGYSWMTKSIHISSGLFARVIPLYNSTQIGIDITDGNIFPSQGYVLSSIGVSGQSERQIQVFQGYNQIPSEYFYGLLAPYSP